MYSKHNHIVTCCITSPKSDTILNLVVILRVHLKSHKCMRIVVINKLNFGVGFIPINLDVVVFLPKVFHNKKYVSLGTSL